MLTRGFVATLLLVVAPPAAAQLIQVKTVPLAQADQIQLFPSQTAGMGGVSIALTDTLYDPSVNPAKGARLSGGRLFSSPFLYSVSNQAGGGRTLPLGIVGRDRSWFGGLTLMLQQVDTPHGGAFSPPILAAPGAVASQPQLLTDRSSGNAMAFALLGRRLGAGGLSLGGSFAWARLHAVDGVDFLYAGSNGVEQSGYTWDARLGLLQQWSGGRSAEVLLLRDTYHVTHHVSFLDQLWDPVSQQMVPQTRLEDNLDETNTWGVHVAYQQPLGMSGWRIGALATANRLLHPEIPTYDMTPVGVQWIPWDPGDSWAYNFGMGVATTTTDGATFGLDVVLEPIWTHTWGEAHAPTPTVSGGMIPVGGKTVDNYFAFTNAWLRVGAGQDIVFGRAQRVVAGLQLGLVLHAIDYTLNQYDAIQDVGRSQPEHWLEWTPTWGVTLRFPGMELRYQGRVTNGTGRPGVVPTGRVVVDGPVAASAGSIVAAPSGPLTLGAVSIITHQISISLPLSLPTTQRGPR